MPVAEILKIIPSRQNREKRDSQLLRSSNLFCISLARGQSTHQALENACAGFSPKPPHVFATCKDVFEVFGKGHTRRSRALHERGPELPCATGACAFICGTVAVLLFIVLLVPLVELFFDLGHQAVGLWRNRKSWPRKKRGTSAFAACQCFLNSQLMPTVSHPQKL